MLIAIIILSWKLCLPIKAAIWQNTLNLLGLVCLVKLKKKSHAMYKQEKKNIEKDNTLWFK